MDIGYSVWSSQGLEIPYSMIAKKPRAQVLRLTQCMFIYTKCFHSFFLSTYDILHLHGIKSNSFVFSCHFLSFLFLLLPTLSFNYRQFLLQVHKVEDLAACSNSTDNAWTPIRWATGRSLNWYKSSSKHVSASSYLLKQRFVSSKPTAHRPPLI